VPQIETAEFLFHLRDASVVFLSEHHGEEMFFGVKKTLRYHERNAVIIIFFPWTVLIKFRG
jgi:hypothetical protein